MATIYVRSVAQLYGVSGAQIRWMRDFDGEYTLAILVVLIKTPNGCILINTGPSPNLLEMMNTRWQKIHPRRHMEITESLEDTLSWFGVSADEVTHIVVTPLQLYTTGNLLKFPNAKICVSKAGWRRLMDPAYAKHPHDPWGTMLPQEVLHYLAGPGWNRLQLIGRDEELVPNVRVGYAGCHHRSSLWVTAVSSQYGSVSITDAIMLKETVREGWPLGISENMDECLAVLRRFQATDVAVPLYDPSLHGQIFA